MRARRLRRDAAFPTYELILNSEEEARATTKTLENVAIGSKLMLKCELAKEAEFEKLVFRYKNEDIGETSGSSRSYQIDSFQKEHSGIYECGATRKKDGKYHSRQIRVSNKREKKSGLGLLSCPIEDEPFCGDHGECFLDDSRKVCHCDDGFMGEQCDKVLMAAYDVKLWKVYGGTTTSLNVVSIAIAIIFILLFCRERTAKNKLRQQIDKIQNMVEDHKCSVSSTSHPEVPQKVQIKGSPVTRSSDGFARNSVKKMRLAFNRTRLNGTSDPKLIEK